MLVNKRLVPAAPFGTTHELFGLDKNEQPHLYTDLADELIDCPPANYWLSRVRVMQPPFGTNWDTTTLKGPLGVCMRPATARMQQCAPAAMFLHGFNLAGQQPITRANDPFWNMRALDALMRHDGYRLSSFICSMNQLVMDDITLPPRSNSVVTASPPEHGLTPNAGEPNFVAEPDGAKSTGSQSVSPMLNRRKATTPKRR